MEVRPRAATLHLPGGEVYLLVATGESCTLRVGGTTLARTRIRSGGSAAVSLDAVQGIGDRLDPRPLRVLLHGLFESYPGLMSIGIDPGEWDGLIDALMEDGTLMFADELGRDVVCTRAMLRQMADFWLTRRNHPYPLVYTVTGGRRHPLRPPKPPGEVYRRYVPDLECWMSLRTIDPAVHLDSFHRWMNDPRVLAFWELAGTLEEHRSYVDKVLADRHMHPVVGCFDDEPFGYFEIYWAKEDRIAPFYAVDDYDRGIHMLVGEAAFRGPHRVAAWLPSLAHYLFLDDPRTRNVVAEPRSDNAKMIGYLQQAGFYKEKEFDFPHKRAAMMILPREVFFDRCCI